MEIMKPICPKHTEQVLPDLASSSLRLKSASWDAEELLRRSTLKPSTLSGWRESTMKDLIRHDMESERDSAHLSRAIHTINHKLSAEFLAFEQLWRRDEYNHYRGFRYLLSLCSGERLCEEVEAEACTADFNLLQPFLVDEFHLCLLLAYDELITRRLYISEYPSYDEAGDPIVSSWIRLVVRDEGYHFGNLLKVILVRFPDRFGEVEEIVNSIIGLELSAGVYQRTFVLDRVRYRPSRAFLQRCAQPLLLFAGKHVGQSIGG